MSTTDYEAIRDRVRCLQRDGHLPTEPTDEQRICFSTGNAQLGEIELTRYLDSVGIKTIAKQ